MKFVFIVFTYCFAIQSHASNQISLPYSPWLEGYSLKVESEIQTQRQKKQNYIDGYESEFEVQLRKKLSNKLSLVMGGKLEGEQEDNEAAYYAMKETITGVRYKIKSQKWKFRTQATFHYYTESEYRKDKGVDGAIRLRVRGKRVFAPYFEGRFRARYYQYLQTTGEEGTRQRRLRFEARPLFRLRPLRLGMITRFEHRKNERDVDDNFIEFGPMVRWDITKDINLIFNTDYQVWNNEDGPMDLWETKPTYQLEFQVTI